ncbi:hypothetical protein DXJ58_16090 [Vibrio fluvialis]|nr:hypothetical protein [Vibrio fluvialis]
MSQIQVVTICFVNGFKMKNVNLQFENQSARDIGKPESTGIVLDNDHFRVKVMQSLRRKI